MIEAQMSFLDRFAAIAGRIGNQVHLRSLRDAFAAVTPMFILAGIAVLINSVIFPLLLNGRALSSVQVWGTTISNGTLNLASLLVCPAIAFSLAKNKRFDNPLAAALMALGCLVIMMPLADSVGLANASGLTGKALSAAQTGIAASGLKDLSVAVSAGSGSVAANVSGVLTYGNLGTTGMFAGIIVGLVSCELFVRVSAIDKLTINLGENVPSAVGKSFSVMIPMLVIMSAFGIIAALLHVVVGTDLITLISTWIQMPLKTLATSIVGVIIIYSLANLLFSLGIHQSVLTGVLCEPLLLANMNENMANIATGHSATNIMNSSFVACFGFMGGAGSTICLIVATLLFSRSKTARSIAELAGAPGLFEINEPVIFGYPVVFNVPIMIPFIVVPTLSMVIGYIATSLGLMNVMVVYAPWTTPPIVNAFLGSGGDFRAVIVQVVCLIVGVLIYVPFIKINDRIQGKVAPNS